MNNRHLYLKLALLVLLALVAGPALAATASTGIDAELARRLDRLERYIYGEVQGGGVADRLDRIEKDLLGRRTGQRPADKAQTLFNFVFKGTGQSPSLDMKLNVLEWKVFNETRQGKLADRIAALDTFVIGSPSTEPLAFRVEQLIHLTIANGIISLHQVRIPAGTAIKVRLGKTISSKDSRQGDTVPMTVVSDLFIDGNVLAIGKGALLSGDLEKVQRGRRFGRSGFVKLGISEVAAIDATRVPVKITGLGEEFDKKKLGMAAGASALGYLVMGPVGLVGGAFVKGEDVTVPEGTTLDLVVTADTKVLGVVINRS
ncbi:MAG: hypothetical protein OZSIB_0522 [Candidatus Ozemobacter sibiricus]|jgi:hypothetical protein|uniref:Uncharacterized protein n=1 Tax=Candidatus Ozemobacter sibiricus TaxID=2268124 RepID=A0A367ZNP1_9BACT|nr:MAG: hypothetical protein OZSIB_0522 [Candidatus Ozemobacter sibiricus]